MDRRHYHPRAKAKAIAMAPGTAFPAIVSLALLACFAMTFLRFG